MHILTVSPQVGHSCHNDLKSGADPDKTDPGTRVLCWNSGPPRMCLWVL